MGELTELERAALDALVAWRKEDISFDQANMNTWTKWNNRLLAAERDLRIAIDRLIGERAREGKAE